MKTNFNLLLNNKIKIKIIHIKFLKNFSTITNSFIKSKSIKFNKNFDLLGKYAVLLEIKESNHQIIFPDIKLSVRIKPNQTIKELVSEYKKEGEKDNLLGFTLLDETGVPLAQSINAFNLLRLPKFIVSIDNGEKSYTCLNMNYLGNTSLDKDIKDLDNSIYEDFEGISNSKIDNINRLILSKNFSFNDCLERENKLVSNIEKITFRDLLNSIYENKYVVMLDLKESLVAKRERRFSKLINAFFYLATIQIVSLNLLTFVFLNWDVMEPITQCLTFCNLIVGYYFWAFTKSSLDPPSIMNFITAKNLRITTRFLNRLEEERDNIKYLLDHTDTI